MDYSHFSCNVICRCAVFKRAEKVFGVGLSSCGLRYLVCNERFLSRVCTHRFKNEMLISMATQQDFPRLIKGVKSHGFFIKCLILILGEKQNLLELFK